MGPIEQATIKAIARHRIGARGHSKAVAGVNEH